MLKCARRSKAAADATTQRYRLAARATEDLVWDWDFASGRVSWNPGLDERCGYDLEGGGTTIEWWRGLIHPEDRDRVMAGIAAATEGDGRFSADYRLRRADGSWADIYARGFVFRDEDGRPVRMAGTLQDVSERNAAAIALREREGQLASIFGQAMIGIMHLDRDARVLMVNSRYCELLGRSEAEVRATSYADWTHPDDIAGNEALFHEKMAAAEPFQIEKRYLRPDGSAVSCAIHVSFVGEPGAVTSTIVIAEDITARRAAEAELERQKCLLQSVIDSASDLIFVKRASGEFILTNRALDEACGPLLGHSTQEMFDPELAQGYRDVDALVMESGEPREVEEIIPVRGERRIFATVKVPWRKDDRTAGVIGVARDITGRKASEAALRDSELLYRSVLQASADCIKIIGLDGRIELMNEPGLKAMELDGLEAVRGEPWSSLWPEAAHPLVEKALRSARRGEASRFSGCCPTAGGQEKWWDVVVTPMCDDDGKVVRLLSISRDITVSRLTAEKLKWTSDHDALTELPNRRAFQARLQAATLRAMKRGTMVGLLLLDLDYFKHVNDTLGHPAGDHLLRTFARRLRESIRSGDFVARLGGDEFALILEDVGAEEELLRAGESILHRLHAPVRLEGRVLSAGASVGGALFPRDAANANELLKNADTALYALKASGRGGTRMFHQHMRDQARSVATQLSLARVAVTERSVVPHYQRKVDLASGRTVGLEALLRWRHPVDGIQLPDTVCEAFKDYELATKIGDLMQACVIRDLGRWLAADWKVGRVSMNAAPAEFLRDDYAERLLGRLARAGLPPALVEIEVTEHVFLERGSEYVARALQQLSAAGVRISLDDFGTGYSSLSHLRDFPVDVVKIDKSFIARMPGDAEISAIVSAVIGLARSLSIDVVAEGVETTEQRQLLLAKGCQTAQGYLFGRPMVGEDLRFERKSAAA